MNKTVVITGAGSGLGRDLALEFAQRGYSVFGTGSDSEQVDILAEESAGQVRLIECDITKQEEVANFAAQVNKATNSKVDILISNAGILTPGPLETTPLTAVHKEFEVNTYGVLSIVNAFLPMLRATKGRIVQVSTLSVDYPSRFNGLSAASKAAAEKLMEIYAQELSAFGISVTNAVCGSMKTGGPAKTAAAIEKVSQQFTQEQAALYGDAFNQFATRINGAQALGMEAAKAATMIADIATMPSPPFRMPVNDDGRPLKY